MQTKSQAILYKNMHYLATLRDKDVFPQLVHSAPNNYEKRVTVKAVARNEKGQFGFVTNPIHGFYLLAGGKSGKRRSGFL